MLKASITLLLAAGIIGVCRAVDFNACSLEPIPAEEFSEGQRARVPSVEVTVSGNGVYKGGESVEVTVDIAPDTIVVGIIAQMRLRSADDTTRGTWSVEDVYDMLKTDTCSTDLDTVVGTADENSPPLQFLEMTWTAPPASHNSDEVIELQVTVVGDGGDFWHLPPMTLTETDVHNDPRENSPETPDVDEEEPTNENESEEQENPEDDHQLHLEIEMLLQNQQRKQEMLDAENLASEGDWTQEQERLRQKAEEDRRREQYQYEEETAAEEKVREERLRQEIMDKEEWERDNPVIILIPTVTPDKVKELTAPPGKNDQPGNNDLQNGDGNDVNGAEGTVSMLTATILTFVISFLLL